MRSYHAAHRPAKTWSISRSWPLNGFGLPDDVLQKLYHDNALSVFQKAQDNAV